MRLRTRTWALICAICFIGGIVFWKMGDRQVARQRAVRPPEPALTDTNAVDANSNRIDEQAVIFPADLMVSTSFEEIKATIQDSVDPLRYRLTNTEQTPGQLGRSDNGLLLRNALIDAKSGQPLAIPQELRASGDPGSYIVQSAGKLNDAFRAQLRAANAEIISYVPNNAYLVRVSASGAQQLASSPQTQSVLPYEPYFKLDTEVLSRAIEGKAFAVEAKLRVTLFPGQLEAAADAILKLEARILGKERSPFGPELVIQMPADSLISLAQLPSVQNIELLTERVRANDMARVRMGISANTIDLTNNFGLSGTNIYVNVNDTGVDVAHPDLLNRVFVGARTFPTDTNGHGTHVAGIIASSGENGPFSATNAIGSVEGANFRGMASGASILSLDVFEFFDWELQETAARTNWFVFGKTNALISNNSWVYHNTYSYNSAAASFDAAVRDSIPGVTGSQPVLFVFAAGNDGGGNNIGSGGFPNSINSPATAKNVITVGAIEQPRGITNLVIRTNISGLVTTNAEFLPLTDSSNQVARFSGRGNVGVGIEGDFGRFKPDVVAPGAFLVSTRSSDWNTNVYYNETNITIRVFNDLVIGPGKTNSFSIFVPRTAIEFWIDAFPNGNASLLLYTNLNPNPSSIAGNLVGTNSIHLDHTAPGFANSVEWFYDFVNTNTFAVTYDIETRLFTTNNNGDSMFVLEQLNEALVGPAGPPPLYRYESGTSIAAPVVSGLLALLQEYLETRISPGISNASPALMKALLINSSRSAGPLYNLNAGSTINYQGWGLPNLGRMLPGTDPAGAAILFFDQSTTNSVATDEVHSREVSLTEDAQFSSIRFSLVWTDPPGNPAVGIKLVNDLDLVVTNLDTGDVYFGNNFGGGGDFSGINAYVDEDDQSEVVINPNRDIVNNVENVYVNGPLGSRYAVSVVGRRVNVNAVTTQTNAIKQDYALVMSIGDLTITNGLSVSNLVIASDIQANVTGMTNLNGGLPGAGFSLSVLLDQRVGANNPYELQTQTNGTLNQWRFYTFTNTSGFTNVAFAVFGGRNLSGVAKRDYQVPSLRNLEADVDLYVSTNSALLSLVPNVVNDETWKSVGRGGNELIILTNAAATAGDVYYIGVKSEDQRAADFGILAIASELPFASPTSDGILPLFFPLPQVIEDGTPDDPGRVEIFGIVPQEFTIRRLIVTNAIEHQLFGDLVGVLFKQGNSKFAILNNHGPMGGFSSGIVTNIYNDLDEGDSPDAVPSDGPGSLADFVGEQARGLWSFTVSDNALSHTGQVLQFSFLAEPQPTNNTDGAGSEIISEQVCRTIFAGSQRYDSVSVPAGATNLTVTASFPTGTIEIYLRRGLIPTVNQFDHKATLTATGGSLSIGLGDSPPLRRGTYYIMLRNPGASSVDVCWFKRIGLDPSGSTFSNIVMTNTVPLIDDALTNLTITVTNAGLVADVQVGVRIDHPRVSDLSLHLVSPSGTRILLFENRGWLTTNGLGSDLAPTTNWVPIMTNGFELSVPGTHINGQVTDGWTVSVDDVEVVNDPAIAHSGNQFLSLGSGTVVRTLPTTAGERYRLTYVYRENLVPAPSLNPVSWWKAENNFEDTIDGNDGNSAEVTFAPGLVGQAFSFDGVDDFILVPASSNLNVRSFTMETWIFPTDLSIRRPLFEYSSSAINASAGVHFWINSDSSGDLDSPGTLYANIRGTDVSDHQIVSLGNILTANVWQHVAFTYNHDSGEAVLYLNGIVAETANLGNLFIPETSVPLYIGDRPSTSGDMLASPFEGMMDEPAIYNFALSPGQIAAIHDAGSSGKCGTPTPPVKCSGFSGSLVIGGDFERPSAPEAPVYLPADSAFDNWVVLSDSVQIVSNDVFQLVSGSQALDLSGAGGENGSIAQTIEPVLGRDYLLRFAMSGDPIVGPAEKQGELYWGGNLISSLSFDTTGRSRSDMGWTYTNFIVSGTASSMDLRFDNLIPTGAGLMLDNITLVPLAEATVSIPAVPPVTHVGTGTFQWQTNIITFTASANNLALTVAGDVPGMLFDSFLLEEEQQGPSFAYAIFTENTNLFPELIKFAQPPFGTNLGGAALPIVIANSFETAGASNYSVGSSVEGWSVVSSNVAVLTEINFAHHGTNLLAINTLPGTTNGLHGAITNSFTNAPGQQFLLNFAFRRPHSSLVNWWPGNSNPTDVIGGQNGTLVNGATYASGIVGDAFIFDGVDDYATFGTSVGNFGTNDFTIDFWMRTTSTRFQEAVIAKREVCDGTSGWDIRMGGPGVGVGRLNFAIMESTVTPINSLVSTRTVNDGLWHHVTVMRKGPTATMYIDGEFEVSGTSSGTILINNAAEFSAGTQACVGVDGTAFFTGALDEIGIHNRAISTNEIYSIFLAKSAGRFDSSNPPTNAPTATFNVIMDGVTNTLVAASTNWTDFTALINPKSTNFAITIAGVTNGVWIDSLSLTEFQGGQFYLPEESLRLLTGERAQGDWTLEVWDNRLGAAVNAQLVSWQLQLAYLPTGIAPVARPLLHGQTASGTVNSNEIKYFVVQVPAAATYATNELISVTGGELELLFNQNALPTPGTLGNVSLFVTQTSGQKILDTISSVPALQPGQRYYLGVRNTSTGPLEVNDFQLTVWFDQLDTASSSSVASLTNGSPSSASIPVGNAMQYYQFAVSSNAVSAAFEILNPSGNVDLYLRYAGPVPTYSSYDYSSQNGGTTNELITVTPSSSPVPLATGIWYLGVLNRAGAAVTYTLKATEQIAAIPVTNVVTLVSGISTNAVAAPGTSLTNFYRLVIDQTNSAVLFELYNLTGNADLIVRRSAFPTVAQYDFRSINLGNSSEQIVISTNEFLTDLNGEWFVGVPNNDGVNVSFTIHAVVATNGFLPSGEPLQIVSVIGVGETLSLQWNSVPSQTYEVQSSNDLIVWTVIETVVANSSVTSYTSPSLAGAEAIFYRVVQVPNP